MQLEPLLERHRGVVPCSSDRTESTTEWSDARRKPGARILSLVADCPPSLRVGQNRPATSPARSRVSLGGPVAARESHRAGVLAASSRTSSTSGRREAWAFCQSRARCNRSPRRHPNPVTRRSCSFGEHTEGVLGPARSHCRCASRKRLDMGRRCAPPLATTLAKRLAGIVTAVLTIGVRAGKVGADLPVTLPARLPAGRPGDHLASHPCQSPCRRPCQSSDAVEVSRCSSRELRCPARWCAGGRTPPAGCR